MGLGICLYPLLWVRRCMCLKSFILLCSGVICGSRWLMEVHRVEPKNEWLNREISSLMRVCIRGCIDCSLSLICLMVRGEELGE